MFKNDEMSVAKYQFAGLFKILTELLSGIKKNFGRATRSFSKQNI